MYSYEVVVIFMKLLSNMDVRFELINVVVIRIMKLFHLHYIHITNSCYFRHFFIIVFK